MKGYLVQSSIRHDSVRYKKGQFISEETLDEQSAKRLLILNVIIKAVRDDEELVEAVPPANTDLQNQNNDTGEESVEEILELNFEWDELKEEAKSIGLEWKGNISKENLIKLIIENKKEDHFLEQLEDEAGDLDVQNI